MQATADTLGALIWAGAGAKAAQLTSREAEWTTMAAFDADAFAETLALCQPQLESGWPARALTLRSPELLPAAGSVRDAGWLQGKPHLDTAASAFRSARQSLLRSLRQSPVEKPQLDRELNRPSALVVALFGTNVADGILPALSDGFISGSELGPEELPPWDTWVSVIEVPSAYSRACPCVVSWVPEAAVGAVDRAVVSDYVHYLSWARFDHGIIQIRGWGRSCAGPNS
jgi:hypothetical protein